jgi:DnaK suppressor protein
MAKAKKPAASKEAAPAEKTAEAESPKPAAKKPSAKKAPAAKGKAAKSSAPPASPYIDTGLAAQTAARLIGAKLTNTPQAGGAKKDTSAFKQLKDSLNKGHSSSIHSVLSNSMTPGTKKSSVPFHDNKQQGHNQTFGSDASKAFVPRRTGGG